MSGDAIVLATQDTKSLFLFNRTRAKARALAGAGIPATWLIGAFVGALMWGAHAQAQVDRARPVSFATAAKAGYDAAALRSAPMAAILAPTPGPIALALPAHDLDCLAAAVYYEARGESALGQAAVAQVVLNRTRQAAFPKSVCGVVFQGGAGHACQFSFVCNGAMRGVREPGAWLRAEAVAARALGGYVMAEIGQATQFHAARLGAGGRAAVQIGHHVFLGANLSRGAGVPPASS